MKRENWLTFYYYYFSWILFMPRCLDLWSLFSLSCSPCLSYLHVKWIICYFNCVGLLMQRQRKIKTKSNPCIIPIRWWKWNQIMLFHGESIIRISFGFLSSEHLFKAEQREKDDFFQIWKTKIHINSWREKKKHQLLSLRCTAWAMMLA